MAERLQVDIGVFGLAQLKGLELHLIAINQALALFSALMGRFTAIPREILEVTDAFTKLRITLEQTTGTATRAEVALDRMRAMAVQIGVPITDLARQFNQFTAAGVPNAARVIKALADAVAAFGGGKQDLDLAALAIQQMAGKGVISMEELRRQLGERIPTAIRIMARELGISVADLYKQVKSGNLESMGAIEALVTGLEKDYGGMTERLAGTWERTTQRLSNAWQNFIDRGPGKYIAIPITGWAMAAAAAMEAVTPEAKAPLDVAQELYAKALDKLNKATLNASQQGGPLGPAEIARIQRIEALQTAADNAREAVLALELELTDFEATIGPVMEGPKASFEVMEESLESLFERMEEGDTGAIERTFTILKKSNDALVASFGTLEAAFDESVIPAVEKSWLPVVKVVDNIKDSLLDEGDLYGDILTKAETHARIAWRTAELYHVQEASLREQVGLMLMLDTANPNYQPYMPTPSAPGKPQRAGSILAQLITNMLGGSQEGGMLANMAGSLNTMGSKMGLSFGLTGGALGGMAAGGLGMAAQLIWQAMQANPAMKAAMDKLWSTLVNVLAPIAEALVPAIELLQHALEAIAPILSALGAQIKQLTSGLYTLARALGLDENPIERALGIDTTPKNRIPGPEEFAFPEEAIAYYKQLMASQPEFAALIGTALRDAINKHTLPDPSWEAPLDEWLKSMGYAQGGMVTPDRMLGYNPATGGGLIYAHAGETVSPNGGATINITIANPDPRSAAEEVRRQIEYLFLTRRLAL